MGGVGEDRSATEQGQDRRRVTVAEASEILGITAEAVRTRIKRGKLDSIKDPPDRSGTVYVLLEVDQTSPNAGPTVEGQDQTTDQTEGRGELVEALREQVAYLQGVIAVRDQELAVRAEEIRRRDAALEREQHMAAIFADRLKELESPTASPGERESPETVEAEQELGTEWARHQMAESTMREGMAEERRRREEAERERDELRREMYALTRQREGPEKAQGGPQRVETRSATVEAQESTERPQTSAQPQELSWWRRMFGS
jgi:hypothetical protein